MNPSLPSLSLVRNLIEPEESRRAFARGADAGELTRVARGAYVPAQAHTALSSSERYLLRVRAVAQTRKFRPVLSHWSAAAIHGLPILGQWPAKVHVIVGRTGGGRSRYGVVKHSMALDESDIVEIAGLSVTSVARTVLDLAAVLPFMDAVMIADRSLLVDRFGRVPALTTHRALLEQWESMLPFRAFARSRAVVEFATDRSESPLESVSRVTMRTIRCPAPILQQPQYDAKGWIGDADFGWDRYNAVGEADGLGKYLEAGLRNGRTAEQVVVDEKIREDRIRAIPRSFVRWRWEVAINPARLAAKLASVGVPSRVRSDR